MKKKGKKKRLKREAEALGRRVHMPSGDVSGPSLQEIADVRCSRIGHRPLQFAADVCRPVTTVCLDCRRLLYFADFPDLRAGGK